MLTNTLKKTVTSNQDLSLGFVTLIAIPVFLVLQVGLVQLGIAFGGVSFIEEMTWLFTAEGEINQKLAPLLCALIAISAGMTRPNDGGLGIAIVALTYAGLFHLIN
ncbi:hypothetical protein [Neptuniibacter sp. QD37_11]|uniref:hypothetical protein n=1 Tax=Neptuniibacter sp. QD37_11 TaxID=3398209 RepID=UPI0039F57231